MCFHYHVHPAFLLLGIPENTSALYLEDSLESSIANKKHKRVRSVALKSAKKDTCLYNESWNLLFHLSLAKNLGAVGGVYGTI